MKKPEAPCYKCPYRNATCHANCEKYKKYAEDNAAWTRERNERVRRDGEVVAVERHRTKRVRAILRKRPK